MVEVSKIIHDVKYTAQFKGVEYAKKVEKECSVEGCKRLDRLKFADILFREVFVEPKGLDLDYFDKYEDPYSVFCEVLDFGNDVINGITEPKISRSKAEKRVRENWAMWRLVLSDMGNFTYDYVFHQMTPQEIQEANIAMDIALASMKKKIK